MTDSGGRPLRSGTTAVWLVLLSITSVQAGAAIAKGLFGTVTPTGMVWLRLVTAAVVLSIVVRPRIRGRSAHDWYAVAGFGAALATMNWAIYQSFSRIPMGTAVTIEFTGPLLVAVFGSRRPRDLVWVVLAAAGVALLGLIPGRLDVGGVGFAFLAGAAWAAYILLSRRVGQRWQGVSGLSLACVLAALLVTGPAIVSAGSSLAEPRILLIGVAVGLLSSVIPYSLELTALRTMPTRVFGILMSLEPAAAAGAALVLLGERLTPVECLAMVCVVAASIGATRR